MPTTPSINLTATLDDLSGGLVTRGQLVITLCGYGLVLPKIVGTAMVAKTGPVEYTLPTGSTATPIQLWGNEQITPAGTFYTIAVVDDKKNVVQCNMYQFTGPDDLDLSAATPIIPSPGSIITPPLQFVTYDVWLISSLTTEQTPALTFDEVMAFCQENGINTPPNFTSLSSPSRFSGAPVGSEYTLTRGIFNSTLLGLYYNGNNLLPNIHYTLNGRAITLAFSTYSGDNLYAVYVATTLN